MFHSSTVTVAAILLATFGASAESASPEAIGLSIAGNPAISDGQFSRYVEAMAVSAAALKTDDGIEHDFRLELLVSDKGREDIEAVHLSFEDGRRFVLPKQPRTIPTEGREHEAIYGQHEDVDGFAWSYIDIDADDIDGYLTGDIVVELHHASGIASLGMKLVDGDGGDAPASFPAMPEFEGSILSGLAGDDLTLQIVPTAYDAQIFLEHEDASRDESADVIEGVIPAGQSVYGIEDLKAGLWGGDVMITRTTQSEVDGVQVLAHVASGLTMDFEARK